MGQLNIEVFFTDGSSIRVACDKHRSNNGVLDLYLAGELIAQFLSEGMRGWVLLSRKDT